MKRVYARYSARRILPILIYLIDATIAEQFESVNLSRFLHLFDN